MLVDQGIQAEINSLKQESVPMGDPRYKSLLRRFISIGDTLIGEGMLVSICNVFTNCNFTRIYYRHPVRQQLQRKRYCPVSVSRCFAHFFSVSAIVHEPQRLSRQIFLIDLLHYAGHKQCGSAYNLKHLREVIRLPNSSVMEQTNYRTSGAR